MLVIRNFQSALGSRAKIGISNASKHAFVQVNGKDLGTVRRFKVANALECIKTLNTLCGTEIWRLV